MACLPNGLAFASYVVNYHPMSLLVRNPGIVFLSKKDSRENCDGTRATVWLHVLREVNGTVKVKMIGKSNMNCLPHKFCL